MKTFTGAPVLPIDEILERTLHVQAKNTEIARLTAERNDLAAKLEAAQVELHDLRIKVGLERSVSCDKSDVSCEETRNAT